MKNRECFSKHGLAGSLCLLLALCASTASASVTKADPANGTQTTEFPGVGRFGDVYYNLKSNFTVAGVAILDGRHILTTRHSVTTDQSVTGDLRSADLFRFEAYGVTYQGQEIFADFGADLAVIRLDGVVQTSYSLWSSLNGSEVGKTFQAVGFGYADPDGDGYWGPGPLGTKRLFANRVDEITTGSFPGQGTILEYDFDLLTGDPVSDMEGIAGIRDSGGGAFIHDGSQWLLAGLISSSGDPVDQASGSLVRIADYQEAIANVVPEPATMILLVLGGMCGLLRRRRVKSD
ncbi:MAG: PEP-CTERM sorting domain-containing protein [bacterium]|nr:PEP-CTERM sorting domain-containing protein [bacterium]